MNFNVKTYISIFFIYVCEFSFKIFSNNVVNSNKQIKNICFVIDQYGLKTTNGCISFVKEWSKEFIKRGYNINVLCGNGISEYGENIFETGIQESGLVSKAAKKQGFSFAKVNKEVVEKALKNIDIVHFITPFELSNYVKDYCDKNNIKTTVTYATLPHNVGEASGLICTSLITSITNKKWKKFYDKFENCNSISKVVDDYLVKKKYRCKCKMFYHGVNNNFIKKDNVIKPEKYKDKFIIITVGRLSNEKRQDLVIKAISKSKFKDKIKLIIAGNGPKKKKYEKLVKKYNIDCEFNFYSRDELIDVLNYCDIYCHCADVEAMGMSALEAICCGVVPIINDAKYSGTKEFALSDKNLFKFNDYKDLTKKIDYFLENPDELKKNSQEYVKISDQYRISKTVDNLIDLFSL